MTRIVGIPGSLRRDSYNRALLKTAAEFHDDFEIAEIRGIPLYDGDVEEASGIPDSVTALKDAIARADGVILATPEYNLGVPGVLKNAIDWCSRPISDQPRVLHGRRVALMGASPAAMGTATAQNAWLPVLKALRMRVWAEGGSLYVPKAHEGDGKIRVLVSEDGERWTSLCLLAKKDVDLRDAKLSVTPDGRLMVLMGGSYYAYRPKRRLVRYSRACCRPQATR